MVPAGGSVVGAVDEPALVAPVCAPPLLLTVTPGATVTVDDVAPEVCVAPGDAVSAVAVEPVAVEPVAVELPLPAGAGAVAVAPVDDCPLERVPAESSALDEDEAAAGDGAEPGTPASAADTP